jgi:hypothetical protein
MALDRYEFPPLDTRQRFGRTLTAWSRRNGWIHDTLHLWGEQAGFPAVRDSSFNRLQNAKTEQPSPLTFIQLAMANARVAAGDYSGVVDRSLKDRLQGSTPICTPEGQPWGPMEFFGHFVGQLDAPEWASGPDPLSAEQLQKLSTTQQQRFEAIADAKGISPALAWRQLEAHCTAMTPSQRQVLRDVLSGWHVWDSGEWEALASDGSDPVADALAAWEKG